MRAALFICSLALLDLLSEDEQVAVRREKHELTLSIRLIYRTMDVSLRQDAQLRQQLRVHGVYILNINVVAETPVSGWRAI